MTQNERKRRASVARVREAEIENYLVEQVELRGGLCEKFICPGKKGVPDRIVTWQYPKIDFVECKKPRGGRVEVLQRLDHAARRVCGHLVRVLRTFEDVDAYIDRRRDSWVK